MPPSSISFAGGLVLLGVSVSALSNQVGAVVKLVRADARLRRAGLSLLTRRLRDETGEAAPRAMANLRVNQDAW